MQMIINNSGELVIDGQSFGVDYMIVPSRTNADEFLVINYFLQLRKLINRNDVTNLTNTSRAALIAQILPSAYFENEADLNLPMPVANDDFVMALNGAWVRKSLAYAQSMINQKLTDITLEPTGFVSGNDAFNGDIGVTYDAEARTITLAGDFTAYFRGEVIEELVDGWESDAHAENLTESKFLVYDGSAFSWAAPADVDFSWLLIAYVVADANGVLFVTREVHGLMQWQLHQHLHRSIGTLRIYGGDLDAYTLNSNVEANRRPTISTLTLQDEDLQSIIPALSINNYTILSFENASDYVFTKDQSEFILKNADQPYYNLFTGGAWTQAALGANSYTCYWHLAIPTTRDDSDYKHIFVQGQSAGTLAQMQALSPKDLFMGSLASLIPESYFCNKIIIRYIANNWIISEVQELRGSKLLPTVSTGGYLTAVSTDDSLKGNGTVANPLGLNKILDNTELASADNVGTMRYQVTAGASCFEMVMQTGEATYEWVTLKENVWGT